MCDDEKDDVLSQAYYKCAREDGHHPESYQVLKNVMKQKDEAFAKVVWIQIAHLIKMVQFRCGSKFTVLPTDGINSDQWRREYPANREPSQLTRIRKIRRKRKIRDLKALKSQEPKRSKHQRQHGVIENRTLFN
ncbi:unnamed protein product [Porites lobata]|uniref:Uncharacterized protein n=1 Tax=Porites lobata TaxID=104759 RepID=A0ABN8RRZ1_9CNID|nr:unnamed protein product [Porites lobata]